MKVELFRNPNPKFSEVAEIIAKGPPPEWLVLGLEHFSDFIGEGQRPRKEDEGYQLLLRQMDDAVELLIKRLPLFQHLPLGLPCPDDVTVALVVLPRIKQWLSRVTNPSLRRVNAPRKFCAAVVVKAWEQIYERAEPQSVALPQACDEYWQACGHEQRGQDIENWRRDAEEAIKENYEAIAKIFAGLRAAVQN